MWHELTLQKAIELKRVKDWFAIWEEHGNDEA
jgi:hypothetical protein